MPRLAWLTDLHLDFLDEKDVNELCNRVRALSPDRLLVGGDTGEASTVMRWLGRLAGELELPIDFVLGNHDYYGSQVGAVRHAASLAHTMNARLGWLPSTGVVPLSEKAALIGVDGWSDGRAGDWSASTVMLNDYLHIDDLVTHDKAERRRRLEALGDESAARLAVLLDEALARFTDVVVLTHVPPFREACWHEGKISNDDWLPHFTCVATGEVLQSKARMHPDRRLTVLCGHTHSDGIVQISPNLVVHTGAARYGTPGTPMIFAVG